MVQQLKFPEGTFAETEFYRNITEHLQNEISIDSRVHSGYKCHSKKKVTPLNQGTDNWYIIAKLITSLFTGFEYWKLTVL